MGLKEITNPEEIKNLKGKPIYSALFLTEESQEALLDWVQEQGHPLLSEVKAHHLTLEFKPADVSNLPVGEKVSLGITGFYEKDGIQCVSVLWPIKNLTVASGAPHITISHLPDVPPKRSLEIMPEWTSYEEPRIGPMLEAVVGVYGNVK